MQKLAFLKPCFITSLANCFKLKSINILVISKVFSAFQWNKRLFSKEIWWLSTITLSNAILKAACRTTIHKGSANCDAPSPAMAPIPKSFWLACLIRIERVLGFKNPHHDVNSKIDEEGGPLIHLLLRLRYSIDYQTFFTLCQTWPWKARGKAFPFGLAKASLKPYFS